MLARAVRLLKSLVPRRGSPAAYALLALLAVCLACLVLDHTTRRSPRQWGRREMMTAGDGEFCKARGGTWDDAASVCKMTKAACEGKGGIWNNGCAFTKAYCTAAGGTFNDATQKCAIKMVAGTCQRYSGTYDKATSTCTVSTSVAPRKARLGADAAADAIQVVDGCQYTPRVTVPGGGKGCPRNLPMFVGHRYLSGLIVKGQGARECANTAECRETARKLVPL